MTEQHVEIILHLLGALLAGGVIGFERSFRGRPAGFRTHSLVCLASSLLMMITFYQAQWLPDPTNDMVRSDPARMAQGIMTGIGFLGAGVIFKEGLSVRGLTTAASIWITASIGILIGVGFYFPAIVATLLTLGVLSIFRIIETKLPTQSYVHLFVSFDHDQLPSEKELILLLKKKGFIASNIQYCMNGDDSFEYHMIVRTSHLSNIKALLDMWRDNPAVREFRISPTGD